MAGDVDPATGDLGLEALGYWRSHGCIDAPSRIDARRRPAVEKSCYAQALRAVQEAVQQPHRMAARMATRWQLVQHQRSHAGCAHVSVAWAPLTEVHTEGRPALGAVGTKLMQKAVLLRRAAAACNPLVRSFSQGCMIKGPNLTVNHSAA